MGFLARDFDFVRRPVLTSRAGAESSCRLASYSVTAPAPRQGQHLIQSRFRGFHRALTVFPARGNRERSNRPESHESTRGLSLGQLYIIKMMFTLCGIQLA